MKCHGEFVVKYIYSNGSFNARLKCRLHKLEDTERVGLPGSGWDRGADRPQKGFSWILKNTGKTAAHAECSPSSPWMAGNDDPGNHSSKGLSGSQTSLWMLLTQTKDFLVGSTKKPSRWRGSSSKILLGVHLARLFLEYNQSQCRISEW